MSEVVISIRFKIWLGIALVLEHPLNPGKILITSKMIHKVFSSLHLSDYVNTFPEPAEHKDAPFFVPVPEDKASRNAVDNHVVFQPKFQLLFTYFNCPHGI